MKKVGAFFLWLFNQVVFPNIIWLGIIGAPSAIVAITYAFRIVIQKELLVENFVIFLICILICIVTMLVNIVGVFIWRVQKKKESVFQKVTSDYEIDSAEFELYFKDRTHIVQRQSARIISCIEGLETIDHTMMWTGQKYIRSELSSDSRGMSLIDSKRKNPPYDVQIKFDEPLPCNVPKRYGFETVVEDANESMMPMLSKVIKCKMANLTMKVSAPQGMIVNAKGCVTTDSMRDIEIKPAIEIKPKRVGDMELFEWDVEDLELLRCYSISWEFAKND